MISVSPGLSSSFSLSGAASSSGSGSGQLIEPLIRSLAGNQAERCDSEEQLQLRLNAGEQVTETEYTRLQEHGYFISHSPETIERFRDFHIPQHQGLAQAIRAATPQGGLLLDKYRAYRPGPAGIGKGYDEIFNLFEKHATEKRTISETLSSYVQTLFERCPESVRWHSPVTLVDLACGNGEQTALLTQHLTRRMPNTRWNVIGIDNQAACIEKCQQQPFPASQVTTTFVTHDLLDSPPPAFQNKGEVIVVSHLYFRNRDVQPFVERLKEWRAQNALIVFINGTQGTDGDELANKNSHFMRGKPSDRMSEDFEAALSSEGYKVKTFVEESYALFPPLTPAIREELLNIKRGDYETPYTGADDNFRVFKGLMEFYASFPLEALTDEERGQYLDSLERTFEKNGGSFLKIANRILLAHSKDSQGLFQRAFKETYEEGLDVETLYVRVEELMTLKNYKTAVDLLNRTLRKVYKALDSAFSLPAHQHFIRGLEQLSQIYLQQELYPQAAGLLWYAKCLEKHQGGSDQGVFQRLDIQIEQVERTFLSKRTSFSVTIGGLSQATKDRDKLNVIRQEIKGKLDAINAQVQTDAEKATALRELYREITLRLKDYIATMTVDSIRELEQVGKTLPCAYALIGLGSLAREEMTPYSDFEFAFIVENESNNQYFRDLTLLLHLKIINLGETILPSLDLPGLSWIYDEITPRGLGFDGNMPWACKTPIGKQARKKGDYELIHTPKNLVQLQRIEEDQYLKKYHLPTVLSNVTHVIGSEDLVREYEEEAKEEISPNERQRRALILMETDLNRFSPDFQEESTGKVHQVKKDLYRLMNTMLDALADYYQLVSKSSWDRIEELQRRGIFTPSGAQDLKELIMLSQGLRLSVYFGHEKQREDVADIEQNQQIITQLYYRLIPFFEVMQRFYTLAKENHDPSLALQQERFFADSFYVQGLVAQRQMQYLKANEAFSQEECQTTDYLERFGDLKQTLGDYPRAIELYVKAINALEGNSILKAHLWKKKGNALKEMGFLEDADGAYDEAKHMLITLRSKKKALPSQIEMFQKDLEGVYHAQASLQIYTANFCKAKATLKLAEESINARTRSLKKDTRYGVKIDLHLAENNRLKADIANHFDSDFKKAENLRREAKKILEGFYKRPDHPKVMACFQDLSLGESRRKLKIYQQWFGAENPSVAATLNEMGAILSNVGSYQQALELDQQALTMRRRLFGDHHPLVATSLNNVALTLDRLGRHQEALALFHQGLAMQRKLFGKFHPDVAVSLNNLGSTLGSLGDHQEALRYKEEALAIDKKLFGDHHPSVAVNLNNIGLTLGDLGRHQEALKLKQQALDMKRKLFGQFHPHVATSLTNVASTLGSLGRPQEALAFQQEALVMRRKLFGQFHPDIAVSLNNVGLTLGELGRHQEALQLTQQGLEMQRRFFGELHSNVAASLSNVGFTLASLGRHQEAFEVQRQALEMQKKLLGEFHPSVAISLGNFGSTLGKLGRYQEALELFQQALEIQKKTFNEDHPDVASSLSNLGLALGELGRQQEALKLERKALEMRRKLFGDQHLVLAASLNQVGGKLVKLGRYQEALAEFQQALQIARTLFSEPHPSIATSLSNIGTTLGQLERHQEAFELQQQALEMQRKLFGEFHADVGTSLTNVGSTLDRLGRHQEALQLHQQALEMQRKLFGTQHPLVAASLNNLGQTLDQLGYHQEALQSQQQALEMRRKLFGEQHPLVALSLNNLGITLGKLGLDEKALKLFQQALEIVNSNDGEDHSRSSQLQQMIKESKSLIIVAQLFKDKKYHQLYLALNSMVKEHGTMTNLCCRLYFSALLSRKNKKEVHSCVNFLKEITENSKFPLIERARTGIILADYYFKRRLFSETIKHGSFSAHMEPMMLFTYQPIEVAGMEEKPAVAGERVPVNVLGKYYVLKAQASSQGREPAFIAACEKQAQELITLLDAGPWTGHKAQEIRRYAEGWVTPPPPPLPANP